MQLTELKDFFYCYSPRLRRFFHENNVGWIEKGINKNSGYPYWIYIKDNKLNETLQRYDSK